MVEIFNTIIVGVLSLIAGVIAMSRPVLASLAIHVGLVLVSLGFLGLFLVALAPFTYISAIATANAFVHAGLVVCCVGYARRVRRSGQQKRRASDWMDIR